MHKNNISVRMKSTKESAVYVTIVTKGSRKTFRKVTEVIVTSMMPKERAVNK